MGSLRPLGVLLQRCLILGRSFAHIASAQGR